MPRSIRVTALLVVLLALFFETPAAVAQEAAPGAPAEPEFEVPTAPVELDGTVLFRLRGITAYPAERRAAAVADRIRQAAGDPRVKIADLRVQEVGGTSEIRAGQQLIVSLFEADARLEGLRHQDLALAYSQVLGPAIEEYRRARSPERLWPAAGQAALATALLVLLVTLVLRLARRFDAALLRRFERHVASLEARSFDIVRAERLQSLIRVTARTVRAALLVAALYLYLDYTLFLFPWTRAIAVRLTSWVVGPLRTLGAAFVAAIPDLVFLAILAVVVRYGLKLLRLFFDGVGSGRIRFEGFDAEWAQPTYKIARVLAIAFALVVAYPYIPGSSSEAFKGVSLFLGVVFSLGSSSVISNVIAGYSMTYRRAFRLGDRVRIGSVVGDVTAVRLQVTHIRTVKNEEVVVPNSTILTTDVTNYSALARTQGLILHTSVGIGYEVPWRQVEAMLLLAAERTAGLEREPAPFVLQTALGDFAVSYELNVYCRKPQEMLELYAELHRNIQDAFNEHGVQIMTPNYMADTPEPKVVPKERWFASPAKPTGGGSTGEAAPARPAGSA